MRSWRPVLDTVRQQFPQTTLWRRQMVLGPGKEFALIAPLGVDVAAPSGWSALAIERVRVDEPLIELPPDFMRRISRMAADAGARKNFA